MLAEREDMKRQLEAQREEHRLAMEAQREEHRRELEELKKAREADKEVIMQEVLSLMKGAQGNEALQQPNNGNNGTAQVAAPTNMTRREEEQTTSDEHPLPHNTEKNQHQPQAVANKLPSVAHRTTRSSAATKEGNTSSSYIGLQQLKEHLASKKRSVANKKKDQVGKSQDKAT